MGAESVTVLYRRTREEMPAYKEEVEEALREGVRFEFLVAPREISGQDGQASGVCYKRMQLGEFDRSGRRRPREKGEQLYVIEADQVISAIGQSLDPREVADGSGLKLNSGGWVDINPVTGQTSVEWVFAGGDAVTGPASVVEAIGAGEKAAVGMSRFLTNADLAFWRTDRGVDTPFDPDADPVSYDREEVRLIPVNRRKSNFAEVEVGLTQGAALRESKRCLRCDYREACN
jgi:NADH-quinone oxidoreductase subunit F